MKHTILIATLSAVACVAVPAWAADDNGMTPAGDNDISQATQRGMVTHDRGDDVQNGGYQPQTGPSGIRYVSGGTGKESQNVMKTHADDYSLHVLTISGKAYVSGVAITVKKHGGQTVLEDEADGPMFYADLPAGTYTVSGTLDGQTEQQTIRINGHQAQTLRLSFPEAAQ